MTELPTYPDCFVCGKKNPLGLHTRWQFIDGKTVCRYTAQPHLAGYEKTVHGGIVSALLDEAMVWAAYAGTGRFGTTAELNIRFLKPLPTKKEFRIEGRLTEDKGRLWLAEARIETDSVVFAKGKAKIIPLPKEWTAQAELWMLDHQ